MKSYINIVSIVLEETILKNAYEFLRYAGNQGVEGIGLFAGYEEGSTFIIKDVIIPKQKSFILEQGLMYAVEGDELHRINVWLYENKMELISQIHSHPQEAFHSAADDRFPIVDTYGGISIVVPDFATGSVELRDAAIFRLSMNKTWDLLALNEVESLFKIV